MHTPVAKLSDDVAAAATANETNGSSKCGYESGRFAPNGGTGTRSIGMWLCSGNHSESNPRASSSAASTPGAMPVAAVVEK
jgi:hypothetical protein